MGQQQILIMLVGVIIAGLMIAVAFVMFGDQASASNRDAIANDLVLFATHAQQYQHKPKLLGGGDGSMVGFMLQGKGWNANGTFTVASTNQNSLIIEGVGLETGYDEIHPVKVAIRVTRDSVRVTEIN